MQTIERPLEKDSLGYEVAKDVYCLPLMIVNVCFIGTPVKNSQEWVLVDAGLSKFTDKIIKAAEQRFGEASKPRAIILTHGHFDHIGALNELSHKWDVPIYAHQLELPYLTGKADYCPPDPSVGGGMMSILSPMYPHHGINLGDRVNALPSDGSIPFLKGWRYVLTPGHTVGHISLFRDNDRVLIAGDAFTTVKQESAFAVLTQEEEVHGPPSYFTTDWEEAKKSVKKLRDLEPSLVVSGHGIPLSGEKLTAELDRLARDFDELALPAQGKYINR